MVLVGLASGDAAIRGISSEPSASGLAELAGGTTSIGGIITKDRLSPLHVISAGRAPRERTEIFSAPGMMTSFDALARSYEYVVIDAGESTGRQSNASVQSRRMRYWSSTRRRAPQRPRRGSGSRPRASATSCCCRGCAWPAPKRRPRRNGQSVPLGAELSSARNTARLQRKLTAARSWQKIINIPWE